MDDRVHGQRSQPGVAMLLVMGDVEVEVGAPLNEPALCTEISGEQRR